MKATDIIREVANYYEVSYSDVISKSRKAPHVRARYVSYFLISKASLPKKEISLLFRRAPADIATATKRFSESLPFNPGISREVEFILNNLKGFALTPSELGLIFQRDFITSLIKRLYLPQPINDDPHRHAFESGKFFRNNEILKMLHQAQKQSNNLLSKLYGTSK